MSTTEIGAFLGSDLWAEMEEALEDRHDGWSRALRGVLVAAEARIRELEAEVERLRGGRG